MKQQVQWVFAKTGMTNECWFYVQEYLELQWLAKLGFTRPIDKLDVIKASLFVTIGSEFQRLDKLKNDAEKPKVGSKRRGR